MSARPAPPALPVSPSATLPTGSSAGARLRPLPTSLCQRLHLTRSHDQRAVLEAVFAIDKLPDAALRDRLSSYLDLSSRQIQVGASTRARLHARRPALAPLEGGFGPF